jgi:myosin heavy subunit
MPTFASPWRLVLPVRSVLLVAYSVEKASEARDALVKALYGNLFQAIIDEINVSLQK